MKRKSSKNAAASTAPIEKAIIVETSQKSSTRYKVGSSKGGRNDCQKLKSVSHVTHVHTALQVLANGKILPRLIGDESRLNTERTLVVWLSPNEWIQGFRYGNVAFDFDWRQLSEDMSFYWVGAMREYSPHACRILATLFDREDALLPYDPSLREGPWWRRKSTGTDYWNGDYCLEFMYELELSLLDVSGIRFVNHHAKLCSIAGSFCDDCGSDSHSAAGRFLAGACQLRLLEKHPHLWIAKNKPRSSLIIAWSNLRRCIAIRSKGSEWNGRIKASSPQAQPLARAIMRAYCERFATDREQLLSLFRSKIEVIEACAAAIEDDLFLKDGMLKRI